MEVILLERVAKLGQMGEVVRVKDGFARNYLLPQKKAMRATKENLAFFEKQRAQLEAQNLKHRADAQAVAADTAHDVGDIIDAVSAAQKSGGIGGTIGAILAEVPTLEAHLVATWQDGKKAVADAKAALGLK